MENISKVRTFLERVIFRTTEDIGLHQGTSYSEEFIELSERVDQHNEWQEELVNRLLDSVFTFDRSLIQDMAVLLSDDPDDISELKTFTEMYGNIMEQAGTSIDSQYGKALVTMSRYILLISYNEREYWEQIQKEFVKHIKEAISQDHNVEAIEEGRKVLENRRLDVNAAKFRYTNVDTVEEEKDAEEYVTEVKGEFKEQLQIVTDLLTECDEKNTEQIHLLENLCHIHKEFYSSCAGITDTMFNSITEFITLTGIRRPRRYGGRPSGLHPSELDHILAKIILREQIEQGLKEELEVDEDADTVTLSYGKASFDPVVKPGGEEEVITLWDFQGKNEHELSFKALQFMTVTRSKESAPDDVWVSAKTRSGKVGKVPVTYIKTMEQLYITGLEK